MEASRPRLAAIDGGKLDHGDADARPEPDTVTGDDGRPASLLGQGQRYPLAAQCIECRGRIVLASRSLLADWQHVDGEPPPRRQVPPPRPVR